MSIHKIMLDQDAIDTDIVEALRNSCQLVSLHRRVFSGNFNDPSLRAALAETLGVEVDAVRRASINLFYGVDEPLQAMRATCNEASTYHYENTIAYRRGMQLLANEKVEAYLSKMALYKRQLQMSIDAFQANYDAYVAQAMENLNRAHGKEVVTLKDYPSADKADRLFDLSWEIEPVPDAKGSSLPEPVAVALSMQMQQRVSKAVDESLGGATQALRGYLENVVEQVGKTENRRIYESLFGNLKKQVDLLRPLNFAGNVKVDELLDSIERLADSYDIADVRAHQPVRDAVVKEARQALERFDAIGGVEDGSEDLAAFEALNAHG